VTWLSKTLGIDAKQAEEKGQELIDAGYFKHVVDVDKPLVNGILLSFL